MKMETPGKSPLKFFLFIFLSLVISFIFLSCEEPVSLNNVVDPESDYYVGYDVGDKDGDGTSDIEDIDFTHLIAPQHNYTTLENLIEFDWGAITTAARYHLQVSKDVEFNDLIINESNITIDSYNASIESAGTMHWRVKAGNDERWGIEWSEIFSFTRNIGTPAPLSPTNDTIIESSKPLFSWNIQYPVQGFELQISNDSDFSEQSTTTISDIVGTQYALTYFLDNHASYAWRVRGIIDIHNGEWSPVSTFSIEIDIDQPYNPVPDDGDIINNTLPLLEWDFDQSFKSFRIQVSSDSDFSSLLINEEDLFESEYQFANALNGYGEYYWRVRALSDEDVWGEWSQWSCNIDIGMVQLISPVDFSQLNETAVYFEWEDNNIAEYFEIQIASDQEFDTSIYSNVSVLSPNITVDSLPVDSTYFWRVRPIDINNKSGRWSESRKLKLVSVLPVYPVHNETIIETTPLLDWNDVNAGESYTVQLCSSDTFDDNDELFFEYVSLESEQEIHLTETDGLLNLNTYHWRIAVTDDDSIQGNWNGPWSFHIDFGTITPTNPTGTINSPVPVFSWEADENALSYALVISEGSTVFHGAQNIMENFYNLPVEYALENKTNYKWKIAYKNFNGLDSEFSNEQSFYVDYGNITLSLPANDATPLINWESTIDPAAIEDFELQLANNNDFGNPILNTAIEKTSFSYQITEDNALDYNETYFVRIRANLTYGVSTEWTSSSFALNIGPPSMNLPLHDSVITNFVPIFSWTSKDPGEIYGLIIAEDEQFNTVVYEQSGILQTSHQITTANIFFNETEYYWKVSRTSYGDVTSEWSSSRSFLVQLNNIQLFQTGDTLMQLQSGDVLSHPRPHFEWQYPDHSEDIYYHLQIGLDSGFNNSLVDDDTISEMEYQISEPPLSTGTPHYFRLRTKDSIGNYGDWTETVTFLPVNITSIACGETQTLFLTEGGDVITTGPGELDLSSPSADPMFTKIVENVISIVNCYNLFFAVASDGTLLAGGDNDNGKMGTGDLNDSPVFIDVLDDCKTVELGFNHSFAIKNDNSLWGAGYNYYGLLGTGDNIGKFIFTPVMDEILYIDTGYHHSLLIDANGFLFTTGRNEYGQLGTGDNDNKYAFGSIFENVTAIKAGSNFSFALKSDGTLWATGSNSAGQLGTGDNTNRNSFVQVLDSVSSVNMGMFSSNTFVIKDDSTLWCTGENSYGQLGTGDTEYINTFTQVLSDVKKVFCGTQLITFAIKNDGTLWATGNNWYGQLGTGDNENRDVFTHVADQVESVSIGTMFAYNNYRFVYIKKTDGTVWSTGNNEYGQLGTGDTENRNNFTRIF
jgi:alpha-tubulin suppressor-like RCC1 family protein